MIIVKSASGVQRRLCFSAPVENCSAMVADIRAQLELLGDQGADLPALCQAANQVAASYQGRPAAR